MNPGYVYFSDNMYLNHTALNPVFNVLYSLSHQKDFGKQFRFMDDEVAHAISADLMACNEQDSVPHLLNTSRPNIVFIIMESFGAKILEPLGGIKDVAPNLNKLTGEGVFFRRMYANSFRTDRGIVSVLGGYPAQPNMSILKYAKKVQSLGGIPKSLIENGYKGSFLYGGDLNFAQMELFVVTQKITAITDDADFPMDKRLTKWGVPDAFTFEKFAKDIENERHEPFVKLFLTLSSHEPFDVPTCKFNEPYLNSVAYTDSCLGIFIDKIKHSPLWDNSLIVLVPDHDMRFPKTIDHFAPERHDIFMLWLGGAVKKPVVIDNLCTQADIAATLLGQLGIPASQFTFSRNILNPSSKEFAFYTFPNGFGMISPAGKVAFDCDGNNPVFSEGEATDSLVVEGKALLQCLYDDIQAR
jgi:phosphoglycerol transferase MdoB-like AlkP superfamily enzyme